MEKYKTYSDYCAMVPKRFKVIPAQNMPNELFAHYRDLMDRARWLMLGGDDKVIMEIRGRHNYFRSHAPLDSEAVQQVLAYILERLPDIDENCQVWDVENGVRLTLDDLV